MVQCGVPCQAASNPMSTISDNILRVRERIASAASRAGRDPRGITVVAVTKSVDVERIREALAAGIQDLGENYYQEVREKMPLVPGPVRWHFIGHLQSNKAKHVIGRFALIQSVDSLALAKELSRRAEAAGCRQEVLIEVKLDPAATKQGVQPAAALDLASHADSLGGLVVRGFMGMAPVLDDPEQARPYFASLRRLFQELPPANRHILSMGMTADFEAAILEGANLVRIGTAIFGPRPPELPH